jgi:hypothetical protein
MTEDRILNLQREILAAKDDPDKLAALAEREGIDPALWRYWTDLQREIARIEREVAPDVEDDGRGD